MFVLQNYFDRNATFIDLPDIEFFKNAIDLADLKYQSEFSSKDELARDEIDEIKKNQIPVIMCSTITSKKKEEVSMKRKDINDRIKSRSIILDADFNPGEEDQSNLFWNNCKLFAKEHNTYVLLYPTPSYPEKPRFRAVFFSKQLLNEDSYYQAVHYIYDKLKFDMTDKSDENIKSSNNAPFFIKKEQLNDVFSNLDKTDLQPLESSLWKEYPKPKKKKKKQYKNGRSFYDNVPILDEQIEEASKQIATEIQDYDFFWKFASSVYRSEYHEQITEDQAIQIMTLIAEYSGDEANRQKWVYDNIDFYKKTKSRMSNDDELIYRSMPLLAYQEFKDIIINQS